MRLFTAILLEEPVKDALEAAIERLRRRTIRGRFTRSENLHLTLVFIGETDSEDRAVRAMEAVQAGPIKLIFTGGGRFYQTGGDIYWAGVQSSPALLELYHNVRAALDTEGLSPERRKYTPHLTLGRGIVVGAGFDAAAYFREIPGIAMTARSVSLMKSERIEGKLTYTEIYRKELGQ